MTEVADADVVVPLTEWEKFREAVQGPTVS